MRPRSTGRVALLGHFGVGNIGNEASLAAALAELSKARPHIEPLVVCARPDVVAAEHLVEAVPIAMSGPLPSFGGLPRVGRLALRPLVELARWAASLRFMRSVDGLAVPGTGILDDFGMKPWAMPYELFRWTTAARIAHRPVVMIGVGAGPIVHPFSRRLLRRAARNANWISYRDEQSRAFMNALGFDGRRSIVQPDVVFGLDPPRNQPETKAPTLRIGLGLMAYYGWTDDPDEGQRTFDAYVDSMTAIADRILLDGNHLRILVGEHSDASAVAAVRAALVDRHGPNLGERVTAEPIDSFAVLMDQIADVDAVVATRYHNVVAALMMSKPTVSIGYATKNDVLMDAFGLGERCHHIDRFEVDAVLDDLKSVTERADEISAGLRDVGGRYRDQVVRRFWEAFEAIDGERRAMTTTPGGA
jgi:polysaccharide pyruvyl transferase WcaK-like protein